MKYAKNNITLKEEGIMINIAVHYDVQMPSARQFMMITPKEAESIYAVLQKYRGMKWLNTAKDHDQI